jgi:ferredoxin-NADP reductase
MARTAVPRRLTWRVARLAATRTETPTAETLVFDVPGWPGHTAGQHVDVRLTAEDGYSTQRSYSIAAPAAGDRVELTVQRVPDGEVSPYLAGGLSHGDPVEIRGPVGGWFVWRPDARAPVLLDRGSCR